jgi:hypothetical protein
MNLATTILGTTTVRELQAAAKLPVLEIGSDRFTRADLAHVDCFNFHAARLLTHAVKALKVRNLKQLYEEVSPQELALPHLGVVAIAVLGAAFEARGIGGTSPLESYAKKHAEVNGAGRPELVTFDTYKARQLRRERERDQDARGRRRRA